MLLKTAYARWRVFGTVLADFNGYLFAYVFYFTIMIPFAVGLQLLGDPLSKRKPVAWQDRDPVPTSLEKARRQG